MGKEIKPIAFYLPQYYTFPENDMWWGKGFTDWVNVKKAKALYKKHNQPRIPLNNKYYDLSNPENMSEQFRIAKENGIYGFCYYHYWFDGNLLMEKPLHNMLELPDRINYCMCWANEPWTRAWDGKNNEVIMPQRYGSEEDWEKHFIYLLQFFKDELYITVDDKPVLVLYRTNNIPNCDVMISYWNKRCCEEGFKGIYVVEERNSFQSSSQCINASAILRFEPTYTLEYTCSFWCKVIHKLYTWTYNSINDNDLLVFDYDMIWKDILRNSKIKASEKKEYLGAFVDWDNTPRRGKRGLIIKGATPRKFGEYFSLLIQNAKKIESDFIFINAWNEWAEGAYLEPDSIHEDNYLKEIKRIIEG